MINLELDDFDTAMMLGFLTLARRYGDTEMFNWAGTTREKLVEKMRVNSALHDKTQMLELVDKPVAIAKKTTKAKMPENVE